MLTFTVHTTERQILIFRLSFPSLSSSYHSCERRVCVHHAARTFLGVFQGLEAWGLCLAPLAPLRREVAGHFCQGHPFLPFLVYHTIEEHSWQLLPLFSTFTIDTA